MWRISTHPLTWGISTNENTVPDDEACDSFDEACVAFDEACDEFDEACDAFDEACDSFDGDWELILI